MSPRHRQNNLSKHQSRELLLNRSLLVKAPLPVDSKENETNINNENSNCKRIGHVMLSARTKYVKPIGQLWKWNSKHPTNSTYYITPTNHTYNIQYLSIHINHHFSVSIFNFRWGTVYVIQPLLIISANFTVEKPAWLLTIGVPVFPAWVHILDKFHRKHCSSGVREGWLIELPS